MTIPHHISRRDMLASSAAALALGTLGDIGGASAQQLAKRIDRFDPALDAILATSEPIREIADGFGGDDWKTLFFTSRSTLGSVNLKIAGIPVPVAKKA